MNILRSWKLTHNVVTDPEDGVCVNFAFDGTHDWMPPDLESD